jgi:NhaA family Na+:H+ antiporter
MSAAPGAPRATARALQQFLRTEAGSASLLLAATVAALAWANSPLSDAYADLWSTELSLGLGDVSLRHDLRHWVNDGLMVLFFFLVGMEVRRELATGELTERGRAATPAIAALAGMAVPALVYLAVNPTGPEARGWGIVMATDIAFVLGLLAVVGRRAPDSLRVFLLTLAIVDDIGAIVIIALFYSSGLDLVALAVAAAIVPSILVINRLRAWRGPAYLVAGVALWIALSESGVHPTIAGVLLGVLVSVEPNGSKVSPNERIQELLHPWSSYVIVPVFALANAGVALDGDMLDRALGSAVTLGVVLGLVAGKLLGVSVATLGAARLRLGQLPEGVRPPHVIGGAAMAGIGFTVALFITDLAFEDPRLQDEAKAGVLAASLLAAVLAAVLFRLAPSADSERA